MTDITPDTFPTYIPNPLISSLPDYLKDPANYDKVQKALYDAGGTKCSHSDLSEWSACSDCQIAQHTRAELMRRLGFRSGRQYMAWKKTHEYLKAHPHLK